MAIIVLLEIIWIDCFSAKNIEEESSNAESANNDATHQTRIVGEPKPTMLNWDHVGHTVADAEADREKQDELPEFLSYEDGKDVRSATNCSSD